MKSHRSCSAMLLSSFPQNFILIYVQIFCFTKNNLLGNDNFPEEEKVSIEKSVFWYINLIVIGWLP